MAIYSTLKVSPLKLFLDTKNPRFIIPPDASQESARNYLIQNEDIITLITGIINFGNLMPGDRIIACKEKDKFVVLEGNRRICACQLILNPKLIPSKYNIKFDNNYQEAVKNISRISVDLVSSREAAQIVLARRHIAGPERWSPISKKKFFSSYFESGITVDDISTITGTKKVEVIKDIKDYFLILYAISLPIWTDEQKSKYFNLIKIKIDPFLRLFSAKSKQLKINATKLLKINYDDNTFTPKSELSKETFDKAIYLIAKAVFIDKVVDTRKSIEDVPGLLELLNNQENSNREENKEDIRVADNKSEVNQNEHINIDEKDNGSIDNKIEDLEHTTQNNDNEIESLQHINRNNDKKMESIEHRTKNNDDETESSQYTTENSNEANKEKGNLGKKIDPNKSGNSKDSPKPVKFFANLTWATIDEKNPENTGLIACADEIQRLSQYGQYSRYPIATGLLLRSLIEHSLKYYARKNGFWIKIKKNPNDRDPKLEAIIKYYNNHLSTIFIRKDEQRLFESIFNNVGLKPFLDLIVHQPHITRATKETLDSIANAGVFAFINLILNS